MTAVDPIQTAGRPMDLNAVMESPGARAARQDTAKAQKSGFSFGDFIDVINPLQHIPGVAEIYRSVTNDRISDDARKAGNVLYGFALGGPVGVGAMMAYNAVGDRLGGDAIQQPADLPQVADAETATKANPPADSPAPLGKPDTAPVPVPKPDRETVLLGETVASTGHGSASVPPLTELIGGDAKVGKTSTTSSAASSVSYVDIQETQGEERTVIPNEAGLDRLATHQSNRLPLDVLKALQERHAERTASERS